MGWFWFSGVMGGLIPCGSGAVIVQKQQKHYHQTKRTASAKQTSVYSFFFFFFFVNLPVKTVIVSFCGSESNDGVYDSRCIDRCETIDHWDNHSIFLTVVAAIQREETVDFKHIHKINTKNWLPRLTKK